MSSGKRVLVATDVPPSNRFSGGILTQKLKMSLPENEYFGFYIISPGLKSESQHFLISDKDMQFEKTAEATWRPKWVPGKIAALFAHGREMYRKHVECRKYANLIQKTMNEKKIDKVWVILQGQTMIWIAEHLIRMGLEPAVQYWDHPNWWMISNRMDRLSRMNLHASFKKCLQSAKTVGVPSFNAKTLLGEPKNVFPIMETFALKDEPPFFRSRNFNNKLVIGIAGQLYAKDTIGCLIQALKEVNFEINGKKVEIHHWGFSTDEYLDKYLIKRGQVPQAELVKTLQEECDILYCPYWFDPRFKFESETSSPSKMMTYFSTGKPVFFHGPAYAAPAIMVEKANAAVSCTSMSHSEILFFLRKLANDDHYCETLVRNGIRILKTDMSAERIRRDFQGFLS